MTATKTARAPRFTAAERRSQLIAAASARFCAVGFHGVSVADVAADVGLTAPAVYKHFRTKQALLVGAISSGLDMVQGALARTREDSLRDLVDALADLGADRSDLWILLQREAKFLDPDHREGIQRQFRGLMDQFVERLRRARPELSPEAALLLITAATAVLAAPYVTHSKASRSVMTRELADSAEAILQVDVAGKDSERTKDAPAHSRVTLDSRKDDLLQRAIELFAARGYSAVSLDDIGAAVGIAGPSIYHHFSTKAEILSDALSQASDQLTRLHAPQTTGPRSLTDLVSIYVHFSLQNRLLVNLYVAELINLPEEARHQIGGTLRDIVAMWTAALCASEPQTNERAARLRSRATLTVIDDLVRLGPFHLRPSVADEIQQIALASLTAHGPETI